jgi:hypothetical protein
MSTSTIEITQPRLSWPQLVAALGDMADEFFRPETLFGLFSADQGGWDTPFGERLYERLSTACGSHQSVHLESDAFDKLQALATAAGKLHAAQTEFKTLLTTAIDDDDDMPPLAPAPGFEDWGAVPADPAPAAVEAGPERKLASVPEEVEPVAPAPKRVFTRPTPGFKPTEDPARAAELKKKQERLMIALRDHLLARMRQERPQSYALVGQYYLPGTVGRRPEECYWAAGGDVRRDGTPFVQLLQGVRDHVTGEVHPEWLWGGKTVIGHLNDSLAGSGFTAVALYNGRYKRFDVCIHDSSPAWKAFARTL